MRTIASQLKMFKKQTNERILTGKKNLAGAILYYLGNETPVDTSKAMSNWIVNLKTARSEIVPPHFLGEQGSTSGRSLSAMMSEGLAIIGNAKIGEKIFITNSVDYLILLNQGHSSQAQAGFIQNAVSTAIERNNKI